MNQSRADRRRQNRAAALRKPHSHQQEVVPLGLKDAIPAPVTAEAVGRYKKLLKQQKESGDENPIINYTGGRYEHI